MSAQPVLAPAVPALPGGQRRECAYRLDLSREARADIGRRAAAEGLSVQKFIEKCIWGQPLPDAPNTFFRQAEVLPLDQ
ncbi:MAG: hypothetical protein ACRCYX_12575 [Dermatophilaceae bacterium]